MGLSELRLTWQPEAFWYYRKLEPDCDRSAQLYQSKEVGSSREGEAPVEPYEGRRSTQVRLGRSLALPVDLHRN